MRRPPALVEALGDAAAALGMEAVRGPLTDEVDELAGRVLEAYRKHLNWPTRFTAHRAPFELSVAVGDDDHGLRYAVDVTDYRHDLWRSWDTYVRAACVVAGVGREDAAPLHGLIGEHLDGCPADRRLRMVHGAGYTSTGGRRATLYFSLSWMSRRGFRSRFPDVAAAMEAARAGRGLEMPAEVGALARDLASGTTDVVRTKAYVWHGVPHGVTTLRDVVGEHDDLILADEVFREFLAGSGAVGVERSLAWVLRVGARGEARREKVEFLCPSWGWTTPDRLARLLSSLTRALGRDLWQVSAVLAACAEHGVPLAPSVVAVGPGTDVSLYLVPFLDRGARDGIPNGPSATTAPKAGHAQNPHVLDDAVLEHALRAGVAYLLGARDADGTWRGGATSNGASPRSRHHDTRPWTTAFVTAILARDRTLHAALAPSLAWLATALESPDTAGAAETEALALLALLGDGGGGDVVHRVAARWDAPASHDGRLAVEVVAARVAALAAGGLTGAARPLAERLRAAQRRDGGWDGEAWTSDLVVTARVALALASFRHEIESVSSPGEAVRSATAQEVRGFAAGHATPRDPLLLGAWLSCWLAADGTLSHPTVRRVIDGLVSEQQGDGRWLSTPARLLSTTRLDVDVDCVITTVMVVETLLEYRGALAAHAAAAGSGVSRLPGEARPPAPLHGHVQTVHPRDAQDVELR